MSYFLPMKWCSILIAFQGGNNVAYHMGLGWAAYDAFMSSLAWVCHVMQNYLSSYLERVQCNSLIEHSACYFTMDIF